MKCWKCGKDTTLRIYKSNNGEKEEYTCIDDKCGCIKVVEDVEEDEGDEESK